MPTTWWRRHQRRLDIFVHDLEVGTNTLVSINAAGTGVGTGFSGGPALSADGNRIAFSSNADDLHPLDNNDMTDIFLRDVVAGTTTLVSVNASNTNGGNNYTQSGAEISADGNRVAFFSRAGDFGPADAGDDEDLYLRDVAAGTTVLVTVNADGSDGVPNRSGDAEFNLSRDGTKVVFDRWSDNHGPDGNEWYYDVYVRDVDAGVTSRVSFNETPAGNRNEDSSQPRVQRGRHQGGLHQRAWERCPVRRRLQRRP